MKLNSHSNSFSCYQLEPTNTRLFKPVFRLWPTYAIRASNLCSDQLVTGRQETKLEAVTEKLKAEAQDFGVSTTVHSFMNDQTDREAVRALWKKLTADGINVDTLVCNAGNFSGGKALLKQGSDITWEAREANVRGPLDMVEGLTKQPGDKPKFVINVSTQGINLFYPEQQVITAQNPGYSLSKNSGTLFLQLIAKDVSPDKLHIASFHPGIIYNEAAGKTGMTRERVPFDDDELPGAYAVWASWDVEELATGELRKNIDENVDFLRIGVLGLRGVKRHTSF